MLTTSRILVSAALTTTTKTLSRRQFQTRGSFLSRSGWAAVSTLTSKSSSTSLAAFRGKKSVSTSSNDLLAEEAADHESFSGYTRPVVQWYPGHIAKAERQLSEVLKAVDVVIEVRHASAISATSHPNVASWCAGRPRVVAITHADLIPTTSQRAWKEFFAINSATQSTNDDENNLIVDRQIQNQAKQAIQERLKYSTQNNNDEIESNDANPTAPSKQQQQQFPDAMLFLNAKTGSGVPALVRAVVRAGAHVQVRRQRRGLQPRPLRVGIMGFPNVGKSALINRLLGRKRARTANTPGVTRSLQWIRVRQDTYTGASGSASSNSKLDSTGKKAAESFELLDSPGIIPALLENQEYATLLAACNCIGTAAYDNQGVAVFLCQWLLDLHRQYYQDQIDWQEEEDEEDGEQEVDAKRRSIQERQRKSILSSSPPSAPKWRAKCMERYKFDPLEGVPNPADPTVKIPRTGADMVYNVADNTCQGDPEDASRKILQDFRAGRMGPICLQMPQTSPYSFDTNKRDKNNNRKGNYQRIVSEEEQELLLQQQQEQNRAALDAAKERGIELPPALLDQQQQMEGGNTAATKENDDTKTTTPVRDIGKGLFDGW